MLSVVIPAFNEAEFLRPAVETVVAGLRDRGHRSEVVVVENGSTDGTAELAEMLEAELPEVQVMCLAAADYGAALRAGLLAATGEVVVNFDVDYFDLEFLDQALELLAAEDGPAVVVASKRAAAARDERPATRRAITWVFATVLRLGFGLHVSDTHGMKALRRAPLLGVVERCRFGTDLFDTELLLRAERAGLTVAEVPATVRESRPSRSSILRRGLRTLGGLARLRVALWREQRCGPQPIGILRQLGHDRRAAAGPHEQGDQGGHPEGAEHVPGLVHQGVAVLQAHAALGGEDDHEVRGHAPRTIGPRHLPVGEVRRLDEDRRSGTVDVEADEVVAGADS